jgi:2-polyprenyl-3-methyl-5-hydroxy-6-metoxy-1,4-benzoquinol methylase
MVIETHMSSELEQELLSRQPWMHPFRLSDEVIVGHFKGTIPDEITACVSTSDPELIEAMSAAFEQYMALDPGYELRELVQTVGTSGSFLDIACATGWYSFALADLGVEDVTGVEIRHEQVAQAELIRELVPDRFDSVRFEHEPVSADDPSFRRGQEYDVVLSLGLLYHLRDPFTHLANLRRLASGAVLLQTLTHAHERGFWLSVRENPDWMTKAWSGDSWIPHFADVPDLLRQAGFSSVEVVTRPAFAPAQRRDSRRDIRMARLLLPGGAFSLRGKLDARQAGREALGIAPRYYTYLAR